MSNAKAPFPLCIHPTRMPTGRAEPGFDSNNNFSREQEKDWQIETNTHAEKDTDRRENPRMLPFNGKCQRMTSHEVSLEVTAIRRVTIMSTLQMNSSISVNLDRVSR